MLKYVVFAAVLISCVYGQTFRPTPNNCTICHEIVGEAERRIHNVTSQQALQNQLIQECHQIERRDGPDAGKNCLAIVNDNIATIYNDMKAGKRPSQTCYDIHACSTLPTRTPDAKINQEAEISKLAAVRMAMMDKVRKQRMRASNPVA
ncbi:hypothetical protein WR25_11216 [Diploscapter pachys]|uniref:Saposin B-type domain-containing protein n=1 Tax=Diploscapter pachys TaxID=2018661 RepID=A0A2A2LUS8_9BILA|nr:hypothetical protein WR25_11216 [Diploscapter pachys]